MKRVFHAGLMKNFEPFVNGLEVAEKLGVAYSTLLGWCSNGVGPPHYRLTHPSLSKGNAKRAPRRVVRFRLSEVEEWAAEHREGAS